MSEAKSNVETKQQQQSSSVSGGAQNVSLHDSDSSNEDEVLKRGKWENEFDFIFSLMSVTWGVSSFWRFPYLCYRSGGVVFIFIYMGTSLFIGIPILFQELVMGQYLSSGGMTIVEQFCPILKGAGISRMVLLILTNIYYAIIIVWALFYLLSSFTSIPDLPWSTCSGWWNTNSTCLDVTTKDARGNNIVQDTDAYKTPMEEFWQYRTLQLDKSNSSQYELSRNGLVEGLGSLQWELFGLLLSVWIMVYLIVRKGACKSRIVIWITTLAPYVCLTILLVRALTSPGASIGIYYLFYPEWRKLLDYNTWLRAFEQTIYTYHVGYGVIPTLASYNKFHYNLFKGAVLSALLQMLSNVLACIFVFSIFGQLAYAQNTDISSIVAGGTKLAFVVIPQYLANLSGSVFWSIIFYIMIFTLMFRSQFYLVESLITGLSDNWPQYLRKHRTWFIVFICSFMFLCGIPLCTQGGSYLLNLVDGALSIKAFLWVLFFQTLALTFEARRFCNCIKEMTGSSPWIVMVLYWMVQAMNLFCIIWFYRWNNVMYDYYQPAWLNYLGIIILISCLIWVPAYFIYYLVSRPFGLIRNLQIGIRANIPTRK